MVHDDDNVGWKTVDLNKDTNKQEPRGGGRGVRPHTPRMTLNVANST